MKQAKRLRQVVVEQADIDAANARREAGDAAACHCCPVAQALAREAGGQLVNVSAGCGLVLVETLQGEVLLEGMPSKPMARFMGKWDSGEPVEPGTFWLNHGEEMNQ